MKSSILVFRGNTKVLTLNKKTDDLLVVLSAVIEMASNMGYTVVLKGGK